MFSQRQGRSDTFATEYDLEAEEYVPLPKGDVHKKKEIIQDVTLHDLDIANARPQVYDRTSSLDLPFPLYMMFSVKFVADLLVILMSVIGGVFFREVKTLYR